MTQSSYNKIFGKNKINLTKFYRIILLMLFVFLVVLIMAWGE